MESTTAGTGLDTQAHPQLGASNGAEIFRITAQEFGDRVALRTQNGETEITWAEYWDSARAFAAGLAGLGCARGETIALMLTNRPEFYPADSGAMLLGMTPFSVYNTLSAEQIEYLVTDAETRVVVTEQAFLPAILEVRDRVPSLEHIVVCDGEAPEGTMSVADLEGRAEGELDVDAAIGAIDPEDVLTLIYTSGTTGPPKGVQITHRNILASQKTATEAIDLPWDGARIVSYLPMAHIAERMVGLYLPMLIGGTVTTCPDPRQVIAYLPEVRPNWFFAVPRVWEKLKAGLEAMIANEADEQKRTGMQWALDVGLRKVRADQAGELTDELAQEYAKADEMVFSKLRQTLGLDDLKAVNVGAAPTPPEVIEFFHALGVPVAELWGLSETCGMGTLNPADAIKIGTVGPPSPGIELKLANDGEVLMRGDVIMKGYRNDPEKTAEAIDSDGWLHTGDVGEIDEDGYLKIVDRKKELIINAAGKNMSPANIEAKLKTIPLVGQAIAIGDRRPYLVALVTLDPDVAPIWAQQNGIEETDVTKLASDDRAIAAVQQGVEEVNSKLSRVEQIKKFKILPEEWQPGGDELTPTMKLKRRPVAEKYSEEIEALYAE